MDVVDVRGVCLNPQLERNSLRHPLRWTQLGLQHSSYVNILLYKDTVATKVVSIDGVCEGSKSRMRLRL